MQGGSVCKEVCIQGGLHSRGSAFKGVCIQGGGGSYTCLNRKTDVKTLLCPKLHLRAVITKFLLCRNIFCVCIVMLHSAVKIR